MMHETETGRWPTMDNNSEGGAIHNQIDSSINKSLPWYAVTVILLLCVIAFYQFRINALNDRIGALNDRISSMDSRLTERMGTIDGKADAAKESAFNSETQCLLAGDHIRNLRESMAAHGVSPLPTFPQRLK